jgi:hypothetical protein
MIRLIIIESMMLIIKKDTMGKYSVKLSLLIMISPGSFPMKGMWEEKSISNPSKTIAPPTIKSILANESI